MNPHAYKVLDYNCVTGVSTVLHILNQNLTPSKEASVFTLNKHHFFDDNPDYKTAVARLKARAKRNPHGASARVLSTIAADVAKAPHEELMQRKRESTPDELREESVELRSPGDFSL